MHTKISVFTLAALAAVSCATSGAQAQIVPPIGLAPGSEYQLIFATADTILGSYGTELPYNTFAGAEAALNLSLPSATWSAVTSTADGTNANVNAPNITVDGSYLPVYNTAGILVSDEASGGLYAGSILSAVGYNQDGASYEGTVWTGSNASGQGLNPMGGSSEVRVGLSGMTGLQWIDSRTTSTFSMLRFPVYAISSVLTVPSPEPSSLALLSSAFLLIGGMRVLRRRTA